MKHDYILVTIPFQGLCSWVINIMKYYEVFCEVEPKRLALKKANEELHAAQTKLAAIKGEEFNTANSSKEWLCWMNGAFPY